MSSSSQKGTKRKWSKHGSLSHLPRSVSCVSLWVMLSSLSSHDFLSNSIFMKFLLIAFFSLSPVFMAFAIPATCQIIDGQSVANMLTACAEWTIGIDPLNDSNDRQWVKDRIVKIATWAIALGALLAVGAIVWAGIQYTKAYGEDEQLKKAKNTGVYALIGLILLLTSFMLVDVFINLVYTVVGQ